MIERIKQAVAILDLPSGVIMSIWTNSIIGMSWLAVIRKYEIPTSVITLFGMGLGAFALNKTVKAVKGTEETNAQ